MTRNVHGLLAFTLISLPFLAGRAQAADPPKRKAIRTVPLRVSPAPEPRFALQYRFDVPYTELEAGNAAFLYQTAVGGHSGAWPVDGDVLRQWRNTPAEDLPWDEVRPAVARLGRTFRLLEAATRRERCTWEYPIRNEGFPYINMLLNEYRTLSRLLVLKARLEIHDGDFDSALNTLRCGLILGRDVGAGPNLIEHLVGLGMASETLRQLEDWVQKPEAPNLYWALTALRNPLADIRNALRMETEALSTELPELRTLEETVLSNDQVLHLWERARAWTESENDGPDHWLDKVRDLATTMERYSEAKASLLAHGYPAEKVQAWPALYTIVLDQYHEFQAIRDMTFKWLYVPYPQAREGLKEAGLAASATSEDSSGSRLANLFTGSLPSLNRIAFLDARLARDIAMLRCVEAIRMYAAEHSGRLPDSLSQIEAVPVPLDPLYGRAFDYERAGDQAVLTSPVPPDGHPNDGRRYEITLR